MVGRTPEYLGKKIEPFELKMASLSVLVVTCTVLIGTATRRSTSSQAASCRRSVRRSSRGASAKAARRATWAVRAAIHSPATALSTPSTSSPAKPEA